MKIHSKNNKIDVKSSIAYKAGAGQMEGGEPYGKEKLENCLAIVNQLQLELRQKDDKITAMEHHILSLETEQPLANKIENSTLDKWK